MQDLQHGSVSAFSPFFLLFFSATVAYSSCGLMWHASVNFVGVYIHACLIS